MTTTQKHIPVLLGAVLDALEDINGKTIVDCTFGAGGYSRAFLARGANVIAFDRDPNVLDDADALRVECHTDTLSTRHQQIRHSRHCTFNFAHFVIDRNSQRLEYRRNILWVVYQIAQFKCRFWRSVFYRTRQYICLFHITIITQNLR